MAAQCHAPLHTRYRGLRRGQPVKDQDEFVPVFDQSFYPRSKRAARESSFEGEALTIRGQLLQPVQHDPASFQSGTFRMNSCETLSDHIGVYKLVDRNNVAKKISRRCGLTSAIWSSKQNYLRHILKHR